MMLSRLQNLPRCSVMEVGKRVSFEGFVVDYDEPPIEISSDEYSMVLDGRIMCEEEVIHEGYFYLVAPKDLEGRLDLGIGSGIEGEGILIHTSADIVVKYTGGFRD